MSQTDDAVSLRPGFVSRNPQNGNLNSYSWSGCSVQNFSPTGTPDCCYTGLPSVICSLDTSQPQLGDVAAVLFLFLVNYYSLKVREIILY